MPFSIITSRNTYIATVVSGIALCLSPVSAQAGFQWTPPAATVHPQAAKPAVPDAGANGPLTPEPVEIIEVAPPVVKPPVPVESKATETKSVGLKKVEKKAEIKAEVKAESKPEPVAVAKDEPAEAPVALSGASEETAPEVTAPVTPAKASITWAPQPEIAAAVQAPVVEGFGKEIPLALALRDIVPPSYAFVFATGDIAGMKASWRGGKPWTDVLKSTLDNLGLQSAVKGNAITISRKYGAATPAAPATPSAAVGYNARMSSPDVIVREESAPTTPSPTKKAEEPVSAAEAKSAQVIAFPSTEPVEQASPAKVSEPTKIPVLDMNKKSKWEARPGMTLRQVLESWSKIAGVELNWSTAYDYPVDSAFFFEGTYGQAIDAMLMSFGGQSPAPKGRLYPNLPDGPSVLMIN